MRLVKTLKSLATNMVLLSGVALSAVAFDAAGADVACVLAATARGIACEGAPAEVTVAKRAAAFVFGALGAVVEEVEEIVLAAAPAIAVEASARAVGLGSWVTTEWAAWLAATAGARPAEAAFSGVSGVPAVLAGFEGAMAAVADGEDVPLPEPPPQPAAKAKEAVTTTESATVGFMRYFLTAWQPVHFGEDEPPG